MNGPILAVSGIWHDNNSRPGPKQEAFHQARIRFPVFPRDNKQDHAVLGKLKPYWIPSLQSLIWSLIFSWKCRRVAVNMVLVLFLGVFFWYWPYLIPSNPKISRGETWKGPLGSVKGSLVGDAGVFDEITLTISAKRFKPPLSLEVESLIGDVAPIGSQEFQDKVQCRVQSDGTVSFTYFCGDVQRPPPGGVLELRLRNYRKELDKKLLFLRIIQ
jgi:hypothetical protein